jgi:16S rRNA (guanine527-N7)-methyltransferase
VAARRPGRLLDLGSGGGFPGLPVAAALRDQGSEAEVTLLEPIGKKARFLTTAVDAIGLDTRVRVVTQRAEDLARDPAARATWDLVTARAVASTADLVELAFPLLAPGGALFAWKRGDLTAELEAARRAITAMAGGDVAVVDVAAEGLGGHRLVIATRSRATVPDRFPRDPGQRRRRPW